MQIDIYKLRQFIKKSILAVAVLLLVLLTIIGILSSDFNKIKKFDSSDKSPRDMLSKIVSGRYTTDVTINSSNSMANLGDFTFNIGEDKKLVANISLKYTPIKKESNWLNGHKDSKDEIMKKSAMLRSAVINTMMGNIDASADSKRMRREIKNSINKKLYSTQIEEVYFNKFIIQ